MGLNGDLPGVKKFKKRSTRLYAGRTAWRSASEVSEMSVVGLVFVTYAPGQHVKHSREGRRLRAARPGTASAPLLLSRCCRRRPCRWSSRGRGCPTAGCPAGAVGSPGPAGFGWGSPRGSGSGAARTGRRVPRLTAGTTLRNGKCQRHPSTVLSPILP